jgi:phosphoglucosamine mutase
LEDGNEKYLEILKENFPKNFSLKGMKIVLDCANGAGYKSAPKILTELGAKVFTVGINPNGLNINHKCGSTHPEIIKKFVKKYNADIGIALDGDADRVIMCDEKSQIIDGDQIIAMIAKRWKRKKILKGGVVGTLMTNYGLEIFFSKEKIKFLRAKVGDRYVKEVMKKYNFNLGGEQSGHIILGNFATTGDGLLVALETLFALRKGQSANKIFKVYKSVPQKLLNIKVKDKKIINSFKCKKAIKLANSLIKNKGRLLVRPSGTEPKIRIMCESFNNSLINRCINIVKKTIN